MPQPSETSASGLGEAALFVWVRFLATWSFGGTVLGVVLGAWVGIPLGLIIAFGYIRAVHWDVVLAALQPRSSSGAGQERSTVLGR